MPGDEGDLGAMFQKRNPRNFTVDGIALPKGWMEVKELRCFKTDKLLRKQYFYHESTGITQWDMPRGPPTRDQILQDKYRRTADKVILAHNKPKHQHPGEKYGPVIKPRKWTLGKSVVAALVAVPVVVFFSHHLNRLRKQQDNMITDCISLATRWTTRMGEMSDELAVALNVNLKLVAEYTATMREMIDEKFAKLSNEQSLAVNCEKAEERKRRFRSL